MRNIPNAYKFPNLSSASASRNKMGGVAWTNESFVNRLKNARGKDRER